ncbi:MAG: glycosyltransferase [Candidatus Altiarchaeota archaeon]|nr:glycosyltransferase [Candidatus Altiarchaeota archaeon]
MDGGTVIVIPAWNEQGWVQNTIRKVNEALKKFDKTARIIVVDDGSDDDTGKQALAEGAEVLRMPKRVGKANAVYAGLKKARDSGAASTVILDADILQVSGAFLSEMISKTAKASAEKKSLMVISPWLELREDFPTIHESGIRAFSLPGVHKILSSDYKGAVKGYGLELFFDRLFAKDETQIVEGGRDAFIGREAKYHGDARKFQRLEIDLTGDLLEKRGLPKNRH